MTNDKIAAITAQFKNDIPNDGSSLILQEVLKGVPDEAYLRIIAIQTKSPPTVLILSICLGVFGVDRFYIGDVKLGIVKLLLGWVTYGLLPLIDIFFCYKKAKKNNYQELMQIVAAYSNDCSVSKNDIPVIELTDKTNNISSDATPSVDNTVIEISASDNTI